MNLKLPWRDRGKNSILKTDYVTQGPLIVLSYPKSNIVKGVQVPFSPKTTTAFPLSNDCSKG